MSQCQSPVCDLRGIQLVNYPLLRDYIYRELSWEIGTLIFCLVRVCTTGERSFLPDGLTSPVASSCGSSRLQTRARRVFKWHLNRDTALGSTVRQRKIVASERRSRATVSRRKHLRRRSIVRHADERESAHKSLHVEDLIMISIVATASWALFTEPPVATRFPFSSSLLPLPLPPLSLLLFSILSFSHPIYICSRTRSFPSFFLRQNYELPMREFSSSLANLERLSRGWF